MDNGFDAMLAELRRGTPVQSFVDGSASLPPPRTEHIAEFKKTDAKLQIAYAEVYAPNIPDSHGDFMVAEEIRKMAHDFLRNGLTKNVDVEHDNELRNCAVVESFIARDGDPDFIPGSWVAGVHIPDPELWAQVEKGEINGFSLQGVGVQTETTVVIDVPPLIKGLTAEADGGHWHAFEVRFDDNGTLIGGKSIATFPAGYPAHEHMIKHGTITEPAGDKENPHCHRFSYVEGLSGAPA